MYNNNSGGWWFGSLLDFLITTLRRVFLANRLFSSFLLTLWAGATLEFLKSPRRDNVGISIEDSILRAQVA